MLTNLCVFPISFKVPRQPETRGMGVQDQAMVAQDQAMGPETRVMQEQEGVRLGLVHHLALFSRHMQCTPRRPTWVQGLVRGLLPNKALS